MKPLVLSLFFHLSTFIFGQCTQTLAPQTFFFPNTTTTYSNQSFPHYLCGPNTVFWDTIGCFSAYCSASTTLNVRASCLLNAKAFLKSGAVLNVFQNSSGIMVSYENGAIINDPYSLTSATLCPSITFPTVNCVVGINELKNTFNSTFIYPNPANDFITLDVLDPNCIFADIKVYDQFGKIVYENPVWRTSDKNIPTKSFDSGSYFLSVRTSRGQQNFKLLILH